MWKRKKMPVLHKGLMVWIVLFLIAFAGSVLAADLVNSVQIGSHLTEERALRQFDQVRSKLQDADLENLRIENLDDYYVVRVGGFADLATAEELLARVRQVYPDAMMMNVYISRNRLVKMYQPEEVETAALPTAVELEEAPMLEQAEPVSDELAASAVISDSVEETAVAAPEVTAANVVPVEEPSVTAQDIDLSSEPVDVPEEVTVAPEQSVPVEADAEAMNSVPVSSVEAALPVADVDQSASAETETALPVEIEATEKMPAIEHAEQPERTKPPEIATAVAGKKIDVDNFLPSSLTIAFASLLLLLGALLCIRTLKKKKVENFEQQVISEDPVSPENAETGIDQLDASSAAITEEETIETLEAIEPCVSDASELLARESDGSAEVPLAGQADEIFPAKERVTIGNVEEELAAPRVTKPASIVFEERELPETKEPEPDKEDRQNRLSRAMDAAVFGEKSKR
ncbi:Sporulation related domain-containing protein [Malonomonas rubra DSM 5091]|uniref:Sporulation related domain-containing protein n=2 Tax=Malonomonas rubra TaxID=57040 RepID=A0A1M6JEN4_MALRU|nr:Sporulation related domain-containing protein [Malonomonas rubra DSM 5091]